MKSTSCRYVLWHDGAFSTTSTTNNDQILPFYINFAVKSINRLIDKNIHPSINWSKQSMKQSINPSNRATAAVLNYILCNEIKIILLHLFTFTNQIFHSMMQDSTNATSLCLYEVCMPLHGGTCEENALISKYPICSIVKTNVNIYSESEWFIAGTCRGQLYMQDLTHLR